MIRGHTGAESAASTSIRRSDFFRGEAVLRWGARRMQARYGANGAGYRFRACQHGMRVERKHKRGGMEVGGPVGQRVAPTAGATDGFHFGRARGRVRSLVHRAGMRHPHAAGRQTGSGNRGSKGNDHGPAQRQRHACCYPACYRALTTDHRHLEFIAGTTDTEIHRFLVVLRSPSECAGNCPERELRGKNRVC